eukprot:6178460-Pleurochrysis_carterae.AAC.2
MDLLAIPYIMPREISTVIAPSGMLWRAAGHAAEATSCSSSDGIRLDDISKDRHAIVLMGCRIACTMCQ